MLRTSKVILLIVCLALASMYPLSVLGQDLVVQNGSFEEGTTDLSYVPGWTCTDENGIPQGAVRAPASPEPYLGDYSLHLTQDSGWVECRQAIPVTDRTDEAFLISGAMMYSAYREGYIEVALSEDESCGVAPEDRTIILSADDIASDGWTVGSASVVIENPSSHDPYYLCIFLRGEDNTLYFDAFAATEQPPTSVHLHDLSANRGRLLLELSILGATGAVLLVIQSRRSQRSDV